MEKMNSIQTVLITGASSGIGKEFADLFARDGYNLLLIARREDRLKEVAGDLEKQYGVNVAYLSLDLTEKNAGEHVMSWVEDNKVKIDCLVNNAGVGNYGKFADIPLEKEMKLLDLNVEILTELCHRFINHMTKNGGGKILNVASMAAFQPGPYYATYYASKAYVLLFTEALQHEYKKDNIVITALCPGPSPTGFFENAQMRHTSTFLRRNMMSPRTIAEKGYRGLMSGRTVVIPSLQLGAIPLGSRLLPRKVVTYISKLFVKMAARG